MNFFQVSKVTIFFLLAAEKVKTCVGLKIPEKIQIENENWQILKASNVTIKMLNAYYDERDFYARQNQSVVKIIAFIDQVPPKVQTFCQLWFHGFSGPIVSKVYEYTLMWSEDWGLNDVGLQPYLVSCRNPLANLGLIPSAVSLVVRDCEIASNYLQVIYNPPEMGKVKPVGVCVRLNDFTEDRTVAIVEWIEILQLLGVDKVFVYAINVDPKMMKAFEFFETAGKVKVEKLTFPEGLQNVNQSWIQLFQNELIPYNDCLYKNMYEYQFLIPLDINEIILPTEQNSETWSDLLTLAIQAGKLINDEPFDGYSARNVFFLLNNNHEGELQPNVPSDLLFLQHVYRAVNFSDEGIGSKTFQNTRSVAVMHTNFPMHCLGKSSCDCFHIPTTIAQLQNYRRDCENYSPAECEDFKNNTMKDLTLWKYKDEILENVNASLSALA